MWDWICLLQICDLLDKQDIKWEFENRNKGRLIITFGRQKKELDLVESNRKNSKFRRNRVRIVNGRVEVFKPDHQSVIDDLLR